MGKAIRYALTRLPKARPYLEYGFLELDNNTVERAMKPVALGRKNSHDRLSRKWTQIVYRLRDVCHNMMGRLVQNAEVNASVAQTLIRGSCSAPY